MRTGPLEKDTCRDYVLPLLKAAGWTEDQIQEQFPITCHRGSARAESAWRSILEYFAPATQVGMTATPKRDETVDSYAYFGDPIFEYSLAQGIDDGLLAYRVRRAVLSPGALGFAPAQGAGRPAAPRAT